MLLLGVLVGTLAYLLYLSVTCFFRVEEGHVAVVTAFGAAKLQPGAKAVRPYPPGLHLKWPWESAIHVSVMEQNLDLGSAGDLSTMTRDGLVLRFEASLRFSPVAGRLEQFVFGLRRPLEHLTGLFSCLLRNEAADFAATEPGESSRALTEPAGPYTPTSYDTLRRHRQVLNARIGSFLEREVGDRYGIRFSGMDLADILPPEELADALNGVMSVGTEAEAHYAHAETDNRQRLLAAQRGVEVAQVQAEAVEQEILALAAHLEELAKQGMLGAYVERRRAEVLSQSRTLFYRSPA